ncbi:MAG: hypothetical protein IPK82_02950 [Polyangiaceae bacterium]|nr:hypothetical protein [Polyangiaceae bacterium]
MVDHRGEKTNTLISYARINGKWATSELELWRAKKGDVAFVPLFAGGFFYRQTHVGWNIPFVIVGNTWLRVV